MHHRWLVLVLALGVLLAGGASSSRGETPQAEAARHYAAGVHAYHQGSYEKAVRELDLASGLAPSDARIFLIRGAAKMRLGFVEDAKSDFHYGANVEFASRQRDVGVALERIQGADRLVLESYRRQARAAAAASQQATRAQEKAKADAAAQARKTQDEKAANEGRPNQQPATAKPAAPKPTDKQADEQADEQADGGFDDPFASNEDEPASEESAGDQPAAIDEADADDADMTSADADEEADDDQSDAADAADDKPQPPARPRVSSFRINNLPPDASDPFANDDKNTLGRGAIEEAAEPSAVADDSPEADESTTADADSAVGGGVRRGKPGDDGDEPLEEFGAPESTRAAAGKSNGGALGAAFRAMMRSVAPVDAIRKQGERLVPGAMPGNAVPDGMSTGGFGATGDDSESIPEAPMTESDGFGPADEAGNAPGNEAGSDARSDAFEEEDPFSSDAGEETGDDAGEEAADDADDDDPFGS